MSKKQRPTAAELAADDKARVQGEARWMELEGFRLRRREGIPAELAPSDEPATEEYSYELGGMTWVIRCERGRYVYSWTHPANLDAATLEEAEELLLAMARQELAGRRQEDK